MIDACTICDRPVFDAATHPCCVFWDRITPGKPCQACSASAAYWANARPRRPAAAPYVAEAWSCPVCGYSDDGFERQVSFGFTPHPCVNCSDRFKPRGMIAA